MSHINSNLSLSSNNVSDEDLIFRHQTVTVLCIDLSIYDILGAVVIWEEVLIIQLKFNQSLFIGYKLSIFMASTTVGEGLFGRVDFECSVERHFDFLLSKYQLWAEDT